MQPHGGSTSPAQHLANGSTTAPSPRPDLAVARALNFAQMSQQRPPFPHTPGAPYQHDAAGVTDPYGVQAQAQAQAAAADLYGRQAPAQAAPYGMAAYAYAYPQAAHYPAGPYPQPGMMAMQPGPMHAPMYGGDYTMQQPHMYYPHHLASPPSVASGGHFAVPGNSYMPQVEGFAPPAGLPLSPDMSPRPHGPFLPATPPRPSGVPSHPNPYSGASPSPITPPLGPGQGAPKRPRGGPGGTTWTPGLSNAFRLNGLIQASVTVQEVFHIIRSSGDQFDKVCMSTAMRQVASLGTNQVQGNEPEMQQLKRLISENVHEFEARNISNTLHALAKMNHNPGPALLDGLAVEAARKAVNFNPQNLANTIWAFGTLGHKPSAYVLDALARAAETKAPKFVPQNVSNILHGYAKLEHHPGHLLDVMASELIRNVGKFTPQALSNTVWSYSKLGEVHDHLLDTVAAVSLQKLHLFNAQNVANTIWAYANLGCDPGALLDAVAQNFETRMREFTPQNVSNILWAYAKLEKLHPKLMDAAAWHSFALIGDFQPQSVANMIWAYATLDHQPPPAFLQVLCQHTLRQLASFSPQNISNTIWALATLKHSNQALMSAVAAEILARLAQPAEAAKFSRQHLANSLWAFASLELRPSGAFLEAAAAAMQERVAHCNPQEISNTVWAFAHIGHYSEALMATFGGEAERRIEEFSQQNLANLTWAFGKLTHHTPSLLDAVQQKATAVVEALSPQHITNIMWTYACFLHEAPDMMAAFIKSVLQRTQSQQFNAQQLSNQLWSLCILKLCDGQMWGCIMEQFRTLEEVPAKLPEEALTQIYQAYLLMGIDQRGVDLPGPPGLLEQARQVWSDSCKNVRISKLHRDVARVMTDMGLPHSLEQLTEDELFSVDIALQGEKIAVEVDGPHHFTANRGEPLGEMRARQRLLDARGWTVLSVPYFVWAAHSNDAQHQSFLQEGISRARQHQQELNLGREREAGSMANARMLPAQSQATPVDAAPGAPSTTNPPSTQLPMLPETAQLGAVPHAPCRAPKPHDEDQLDMTHSAGVTHPYHGSQGNTVHSMALSAPKPDAPALAEQEIISPALVPVSPSSSNCITLPEAPTRHHGAPNTAGNVRDALQDALAASVAIAGQKRAAEVPQPSHYMPKKQARQTQHARGDVPYRTAGTLHLPAMSDAGQDTVPTSEAKVNAQCVFPAAAQLELPGHQGTARQGAAPEPEMGNQSLPVPAAEEQITGSPQLEPCAAAETADTGASQHNTGKADLSAAHKQNTEAPQLEQPPVQDMAGSEEGSREQPASKDTSAVEDQATEAL